MKIVITGAGSTGDTQPLLALCVGLLQAGHQVVLISDVAAEQTAADLGVDFRALPISSQEGLGDGALGWRRSMETGRPTPELLRALGNLDSERWMQLLESEAADADVIVASVIGVFPAAAVATDLNVPLIFSQLQPTLPTRDFPLSSLGVATMPGWLTRPASRFTNWASSLFLYAGINKVRRAAGKQPLRFDWNDIPILAAWSPTIVPRPSDWTHPNLTITGGWRLPDAWEPPTDLTELLASGDPPVYVGFGSMAGFDGMNALRDALFEGLSDRRVLLYGGWGKLTDTDLPSNVHALTGWVGHEWLFPRCAAIAHHCGAGTTHQATASGVPSVAIPFLLDQPFWAQRIRNLGVTPQPINPRKATPDDIRRAFAEATGDPMQHRARIVAEQLAAEPDGVGVAVSTIERLVRPRR